MAILSVLEVAHVMALQSVLKKVVLLETHMAALLVHLRIEYLVQQMVEMMEFLSADSMVSREAAYWVDERVV